MGMGGVALSLATHHIVVRRTGERGVHACWEGTCSKKEEGGRGGSREEGPSRFCRQPARESWPRATPVKMGGYLQFPPIPRPRKLP